MNRYRTIRETDDSVETLYEIQKSRFITHIRHVETEEEARSFIQAMKKQYFDARHNCSAYVLGERADKQKSNDDGEPGGTAGNPILEAIKKNELTDVVIVVTRYFGGIKLGAGGLVRAYTDAVTQAVEAAGTRTVHLSTLLRIDADFASAGQVEDQLRGLTLPSGAPVTVDSVDWTDRAHISVAVPAASVDELRVALATLSAGALTAEETGSRWVG